MTGWNLKHMLIPHLLRQYGDLEHEADGHMALHRADISDISVSCDQGLHT